MNSLFTCRRTLSLTRRLRCGTASVKLTSAIIATATLAGCAVRPAFVASPTRLYQGYHAMSEPRVDVPVGALWVQGHGPYGPGASPDNLETSRSVSALALTGELQLSLTLGIAAFLHVDPAYRDRITARFSDVSIVRVKDVGKLPGPAGQPRIYEALRAGSVTITADKSLGMNLDASASAQNLGIVSRGQTGRTQSVTIDAKDLYVAFRVTTVTQLQSKPATARIAADTAEVNLHGLRVRFDVARLAHCLSSAATSAKQLACRRDTPIGLQLKSLAPVSVASEMPASVLAGDGLAPSFVPLPLPISDGHGGLFTSISVHARFAPSRTGALGLGSVTAQLEGQRETSLSKPQARTW
jgi:hypothetical protein